MRQEACQTIEVLPTLLSSHKSFPRATQGATSGNCRTTHHSSITTRHSRLISFLLLTTLIALLFFYRLGDRDLWSSHEGRAAQDAETILEDGHWGLPRLFDKKYVELQKPPLYYWLVAGLAALRGATVDAWAVRLPSALAAFGCVVLLFLFGIHRGRTRAALGSALILATAVHFTWLARIGRIDMPLTFAISLTLTCFYLGFSQRSWTWFVPAYLGLAVAVLLKGPIGLVLPAVVAAGWLLLEGELPPPWRMRSMLSLADRLGLWWGVPLILAIAGPWFFWAASQTDGALGKSLWYHNVMRAIGGTDGMRARPALFYFPRFAVDFLPWSVLLPIATVYFLRQNRWRVDREARFGLVWLVCIVALLSCVGF
jgi:4-amino-4-deoxy-L-arabinose transferase-like glycosyltransferase